MWLLAVWPRSNTRELLIKLINAAPIDDDMSVTPADDDMSVAPADDDMSVTPADDDGYKF